MERLTDAGHRIQLQRVRSLTDAFVEARARPPIEQQLAAIHRREVVLPRRRTQSWATALPAAMVGVLCALVVVWLWPDSGRERLHFEIAGQQGSVGRPIEAGADPVQLTFSDGSRVQVESGSQMHVEDLTEHGATLELERGQLEIFVVPDAANQWRVLAGPYQIRVTGTGFDTGWDPDDGTLTVSMSSGTVVIDGPCLGASKPLAAPESIRLRCPSSNEATPMDLSSSSSAVPSKPPTAELPASPTASAGATASTGSDVAPPDLVWRTLLLDAHVSEALAEAERLGIDSVIAMATGAELVELGSAARLAGKGSLASQLYRAARSRHPGTTASATAAFHLGRMAFDGRGAWSEAENWFSLYLAERPSGHLAAEALGRSLECANHLGATERAEALATTYLQRYPNGAHADYARSLLEEHP